MSILNKKKYIIGVSGGPDSMALLSYYKNHIKVVCIVNYNKRIDSNNDVELVKKYCEKYNLVIEIKDIDKSIYDNFNENFQSWARQIRYDFFYEIAKKYHANAILIAHNFDDFLETAYMQKSRKSKSLFYGIKKTSYWNDLKVYRPFLTVFRKNTLERMCIERNIPYIKDISNDSDEYERNRVRKIINQWDINKIYEFKKEIFKYNKNNKKLYKLTIKQFNEFKNNNFSINIINKLSNEEKYYLIYNYLVYLNEFNKSQNKINAIIDFINSNSNKEYRLENNKKLLIKNNTLISLQHDDNN